MTVHTSPTIRQFRSDTSLEWADGAPVPFDGWRLHHRLQPNGRTVLEINDKLGDLVGLIASTSLPILSVDAAWRGLGHDPDGTRRWWSLAIGHTTDDDEQTAVTFMRRRGPQKRPRRAVVRPSQARGLWIAAAPGRYTTVSCRHGTDHDIRRIREHDGVEMWTT